MSYLKYCYDKKYSKIILFLVIIVAMAVGYLYVRLHHTIENVLEAKSNWRSELLDFPLLFVDDLNYDGEEHIRFVPNWGEINSEDFFFMCFL
ncbi:hypothetical protein ACWGOQ_0015675 [Aquimarina sp. M1]